MERWQDKVAIVTGASSGIGAALAELLVKQGLKVIGIARRVDRVEELACQLANQPGQLFPLECDLLNEDSILEAFKWVTENVGHVHILVNNAGLIRPSNLTEGDTAGWRQTFDVNVIALCIATREAFRIMKENNIAGHIIHLNSIAGYYIPNMSNANVYPASKFAVTALTQQLRLELAGLKSPVKVTSVSPGIVSTEFANGFPDDGTREALAQMPRLSSEEVADVIVYVLSTPPNVQIAELIVRPLGEMI